MKIVNGVMQFEGAIATTGSNATPFVLPAAFCPSHPVWIPLDMFDASNARMEIGTDGTVTVEAETDFSDAQGFTSLEGASFHP